MLIGLQLVEGTYLSALWLLKNPDGPGCVLNVLFREPGADSWTVVHVYVYADGTSDQDVFSTPGTHTEEALIADLGGTLKAAAHEVRAVFRERLIKRTVTRADSIPELTTLVVGQA